MFLEDGEWKQANKYFDRVLDIDPELAPAYIGKLCVELRVRNEKQLGERDKPISEYNNFQKALRFSDSDSQIRLRRYDEIIKERILHREYLSLLSKKTQLRQKKNLKYS